MLHGRQLVEDEGQSTLFGLKWPAHMKRDGVGGGGDVMDEIWH